MRSWYDLQSLLYLAAYPAVLAAQWCCGFSWLLFLLQLFLVIGVHAIQHNHIHLGIWYSKSLNRVTDICISVLTGVPSAMVYNSHVRNHHVHHHGPDDLTRTYRFGGDHNHLLGYLLHPIQALTVLLPNCWRDYRASSLRRNWFFKQMSSQSLAVLISWVVLCCIDWKRFLLLVLIPQAFGLHWLLGSNYLQHAHCDDESETDYARNFLGLVNLFWFNIGYHIVHHDLPKVHWSKLKAIYEERYRDTVDPRLVESGLFRYVTRCFLLSIVMPKYRSTSFKKSCVG